jgi:glycosyltransferase involved in cell wall biosynthesis
MIDITKPRVAEMTPDTSLDAPPSRPKMLFLIDEMSAITAGGTERQLLQLVEIGSTNGIDTQICVLRGTDWLTSSIAGCKVKHFDIKRICSVRGARSLCDLTRWIREERFHIVQTFFSESNLLGPWIARAAKVPIVIGTRRNLNHPVSEGVNKLSLSIQCVSNILVDQIIVNSEAVLQRVSKSEWFSRGKLCVVHNGIDPLQISALPDSREQIRQQLGVGPEHLLVCNISGLRRIKGVELFVQAAALAFGQDKRLRFVLVGDGELREAIEKAIATYRIGQVFHLVGPAADVRPFLAATDIAVLCSMAEGFSNSLLEYMAAGLPIIATNVGGNREALGSVGTLIEPGDAHVLARAVLSYLDPSTRTREGSAALREVQKFDIKHAETHMGAIYWLHLRRVFNFGTDLQNEMCGSVHQSSPSQGME